MGLANEMARRPAILAATASRAGVTNSDVQMANSTINAAIDAVAQHGLYRRNHRQMSLCRCRPRTLQKRTMICQGRLVLISEVSQQSTHLPSCVFYSTQPPSTRNSYQLGWRFGNGRDYMSTIVALALCLKGSGRGQWSLSPGIKAFNSIRLNASPLMRLIRLHRWIQSPYASAGGRGISKASWDKINLYWRCSLKWLIQEGKASPLDLDYDTGRSVLHGLMAGLRWRQPVDDVFWSSIQELGIPNNTLDTKGR